MLRHKIFRQMERMALLLGAFRLGNRARRRRGLPGRSAWYVWQFLDNDVLDFHQQGAAGVDLDAQLAVERNEAVLLGEIEGELAVDPRADPAALAENPIVVPFPVLDDLGQRGGIVRADEFLVATMFIVEIPPVTDAGVDLIARHRWLSRLPLASHLDAGIHEAFPLDEPDPEFQIEVLKFTGRCEKEVGGDLLLEGTADDHAIADLPPFFLPGWNLPTG